MYIYYFFLNIPRRSVDWRNTPCGEKAYSVINGPKAPYS